MSHILTIPRNIFDNALAQMTDYLHSSKMPTTFAYGFPVSTVVSGLCYWTLAELQSSHVIPTQNNHPLLILVLEQDTHLSNIDWREWCNTFIPTLVLDKQSVILLRISLGGETSAIIRHNSRWEPVLRCELPGTAMLQLPLKDQKSTSNTQHLNMLKNPSGRYSRVVGAIGDSVLQRIQQSLFAVVGAGRTGSLLIHSLVRMGASVLLIDPDVVEPHNLDGDLLLPSHEGMTKVEALTQSLKAIVRPESIVQGRALDIVTSHVAGRMLLWSDVVISTVDNDAARMVAAAWSSALLKPHLDIGVAIGNDHRIGADIRLTLPSQGCLSCVGGFAQKDILPELVAERLVLANQTVTQSNLDFRQQRAGSLRSINQVSSHLGLRLIEQLYAGNINSNRYIRFEERNALFSQQELNAQPHATCLLCHQLCGKGGDVLDTTAIKLMALRLSNRMRKIA